MMRLALGLTALSVSLLAGCVAPAALAPAPLPGQASAGQVPPAQALPDLTVSQGGLPAVAPAADLGAPAVLPGVVAPPMTAPKAAPPLTLPVEEHAPDALLVSLKKGTTAADLLASAPARGLQLVHDLDFETRHWVALRLPAGTPLDATRLALARLPLVDQVEYDLVARPHAASTDPKAADQWAHKPEFANTEGAWDKIGALDQSKVVVAVVDSGIDVSHEEFKVSVVGDRLLAARNVTPKPASLGGTDEEWAGVLQDDFGHGTISAGLIGASGNNGKGLAGVAWGCRIMPIKAGDDDKDTGAFGFKLEDVVAGIKYASTYNETVAAGAPKVRVINMSLGINTGRVIPVFYDAVQFARRKGILVVASAGNTGTPAISPPANTPGVLAVGATGHYLNYEFVAHFSNYGPRLDMVAPGAGVPVTVPTHPSQAGSRDGITSLSYAFADGTSESAPYVSGVAALVFAKYDPTNASLGTIQDAATMVDKVRTHLIRAVDDFGTPGWDPSWGYGRINAEKAVSSPTLLEADPTETRKPIS